MRQNEKQLSTKAGTVVIALLIAQDILLSFILSLTSLASASTDVLAYSIGRLLVKFTVIIIVLILCSFIWPLVLKLLHNTQSNELFLLGLVALCVFLTELTDRIIGSGAVGSFMSGVLISSSASISTDIIHRALQQFQPVKNLFAALFFAAIGLLINPIFLYNNAISILIIVFVTHTLKTTITFFICMIFHYDRRTSIRAGIYLSQIGEFAFVLANNGLRAGIIDKHTYLLLLSSTACSLLST